MEALKRFTGMFCPLFVCRKEDEFPNKRELVKHMINTHQSSQFCQLCLDHRPLFPAEQAKYSLKALRQHERSSDGHPLCGFCQKRFFDGADLYEHMNKAHVNCHLCPLDQRHRYYRNLVQLRDHLRFSHYLCELPPCDSIDIVQAFSTSDELHIHAVTEHGEKSSRPIELGFRVASFRDRGRNSDDELRLGVMCPPPAQRPSSETGMNRLFVQRQGQTGNELNRDMSGQMGQSFTPSVSQQQWANAAGRRQFEEAVGPDSSDFNSIFPPLPTPSSLIDHEELSLVGQQYQAQTATITRNTPIPPSLSHSNADNNDINPLGSSSTTAGSTMSKGCKRRNRRLAMALDIDVKDLDRRENVVQWPRELVLWARENLSEVLNIENSIQRMLLDPKATSIQLKHMIRSHRRRGHELAEMYGLKSVAYDNEPKRYLSFIKQQGARVCDPLLSEAARDVSYCMDSSSTGQHHFHEISRPDPKVIIDEEEKKEASVVDGGGGGDGIKWKNSVLKGRLIKPEGRLSLPEEARVKAAEKERQSMEERRARLAAMEVRRRDEERAGNIVSHETLFHGLDVLSDDDGDDSSSKDEWETAADRIMESPTSCDGGGDAWDDGPPSEPRTQSVGKGMWVCKRCTYGSNSDSVQKCGICGEENADLGWEVVR